MKMIEDEYDVIVVGCGPAGSSAAERCAKYGLKVLCIEKRPEIGSPKRCGEGISIRKVEKLELNIPENCITQHVDGGIIYAPNRKKVVIDEPERSKGLILERKMFDKWLAGKAADAGAKILSRASAEDLIIENGFVKGVKINYFGNVYEVRCKIVVAADGIESMIMRKAGIRTNKNPELADSCIQYEMADIDLEDNKKIVLYLGNKIAPRGYLWVFPKGMNTANVGIGIIGTSEKNAKYYLDKFIEQHPELKKGSIIEVNGGCVPVGGLMKNMVGDGIIGVGDAVNQVNPIHGGGIPEAIAGGRIAGDVIKKAFDKNDFSKETLSEYNKIWWKEQGENLAKIEKIRERFEKMSDENLNDLAEVLIGEDLIDIAHGKITKLAKLMLKYKMKGFERKLGLGKEED